MFANKAACLSILGMGLFLLASAGCDESSVASESASDDAPIDQRLVGRWRHTGTYVSGDFTAAMDLWFVLNADGTFEYFKGGVAAGNSSSSLVNSGQGDVMRGKWRAESKTLFTRAEGSDWRETGK